MNNRIYEEALASALKRIEALEDFNMKYSSNQSPPKQFQNNDLATAGQKKYIVALGGVVELKLTKQDAGILIDKLLKDKEVTDNHSESLEVTEPEQVDSDETGIDSEGLM